MKDDGPGTQTPAQRLPSIGSRLARALAGWALVWGVAVGLAVWLAAAEEVDELLDAGLLSAANLMTALAQTATETSAGKGSQAWTGAAPEHFAWQWVAADGRVLFRSPLAPAGPWHAKARPGFSDVAGWRLYGVALAAVAGTGTATGTGTGQMLYAAQSRSERNEARAEVGLAATLAALAIGLLGWFWLRARVAAELQPLSLLSQRLAQLDFGAQPMAGSLGAPERLELQPVHEAVDGLMDRLAARLANERAFSAHAAHSLRTPLAGIDAQLALALRDSPPPLAARLQRVREAAGRLQGVVAALLGLFRAGAALDRVPVDVVALLARLPTASLQLDCPGSGAAGLQVLADADLLAAALMNLLDNSQRHGARHVAVTVPAPHTLRLHDDGPGVPAAVRQRLQHALDHQAYDGATGLGLMLADRVARAHGGSVRLPAVDAGFAVELSLAGGAAGGFSLASGAPGRVQGRSAL